MPITILCPYWAILNHQVPAKPSERGSITDDRCVSLTVFLKRVRKYSSYGPLRYYTFTEYKQIQ